MVYMDAKVKGIIPPPNPLIYKPRISCRVDKNYTNLLKMVSPLKMPDGNSVARTAYDVL